MDIRELKAMLDAVPKVSEDPWDEEQEEPTAEAEDPCGDAPVAPGPQDDAAEVAEESQQEPIDVPIVEAERWFVSLGMEDAAPVQHGEAPSRPVFAFGPVVETLSGVGECLRIDIPLSALSAAAEAVEASRGRTVRARAI